MRAFWAPGRVNLIGEFTDLADGLVLPAALELGIRIECVPAERTRLTSDDFPGTSDDAPWDTSRARQAVARGRFRFAPGELADALAALGDAVVRPAAGIAYTAEHEAAMDPPQGQALVDRIAAELDPRGVLAA